MDSEPTTTSTVPPRTARLHALLELGTGRGLEVGPLNTPIVGRDDADVRYVDVHDRAGLQEVYRPHPGFPLDDIVEPDFVLIGPDGMRSLAEATGTDGPYQWVMASHVAEHVPDLVGWLRDVAEVLVDGGALVLMIPDRRFCFDALREPTTVGEVLLASRRGDQHPTVRAVYDHYSRCAHVDTGALWRCVPPGPPMYGVDFAMEKVALAESGTYVDCHVWTWTAGSLVAQLAELHDMGLHEFTVDAVVDPPVGDLEFSVRLRRLPREPGAARDAALAAGLRSWTDVQPSPEAEDGTPVGGLDDDLPGVAASLSEREARLVLAKRRALWRLHRTASRLRR